MSDAAAALPTPVKKPRTSILRSLLLLLTIVGLVPLLWTSYTLVSRAWNLLDDHIRETQLGQGQELRAAGHDLHAQPRHPDRYARRNARGR